MVPRSIRRPSVATARHVPCPAIAASGSEPIAVPSIRTMNAALRSSWPAASMMGLRGQSWASRKPRSHGTLPGTGHRSGRACVFGFVSRGFPLGPTIVRYFWSLSVVRVPDSSLGNTTRRRADSLLRSDPRSSVRRTHRPCAWRGRLFCRRSCRRDGARAVRETQQGDCALAATVRGRHAAGSADKPWSRD